MGGGGDLWMVLRHSINAGLVVGIPRRGGTLTPYLMQKNFLHWEMAGTQKLLAWAIAPGCGCSRQSHLVEFVLPNFPPKISLIVKFVNFTNYFKLFHFKVVISYKYPTTQAQVLDMLTEQCENHDQNQNRNLCDELREKQKAKTRCNILIRLPFSTTYRVSICVCFPGLYSTPFSMYCVTQGAHTGSGLLYKWQCYNGPFKIRSFF